MEEKLSVWQLIMPEDLPLSVPLAVFSYLNHVGTSVALFAVCITFFIHCGHYLEL